MASNRPRFRIDQVLTLGVEEEFVLVDSDTRTTAPRGPEVLAAARSRLDGRVQPEYYATQVEVNSRPAQTATALRADLVDARQVLAEAAGRAHCLPVAAGSAVLTSRPLVVSDIPRYRTMARRYACYTEDIDSESCGMHVHLGELCRAEALLLGNHLRPWLPVLQATAVNSAFAAGRPRRCASWRHFEQEHWPTVGPAPQLDAAGYESVASDLVASGVLIDRGMIYWYSRPSEHVPTLEIRVTDVNSDVDVAVLLAVLTRGLATSLLAEARSGVAPPAVDEAALREAHRQAARRGLAGRWQMPDTAVAMPLSKGLEALVERALPGLRAARDLDLVRRLLARVGRQGTGAQGQWDSYRVRRSLLDVVDRLAASTVTA